PFTREEVDIFIRDFSTDGLVLDYKAMIDTYARVLLRYEEDLYMRVCGPEQVYAAEVEACAECPPRCYHSRHLDPRAHELKCICDRNDPALWNFTMDDFAEKLTNAGSPHRLDTVFNDVREPTLHSIDPINATIVHYSRGIWSVVGLPIHLRCPNVTERLVDTAQTLIRRFGFLAPPIPSDTLWWTLRPYTTFGVDDSVDSMLTQMAMVQQRGLLAMLIPTRIIHHRSIVTPGFMDTEELIGHCSIAFPDGLITGRQGEISLDKIVLKELDDHTPSQSGSCDIDAVGRVIDQIDAIEMRMRDAGRLEQSCIDHSTQYPRPEPHSTADEVSPEARSLKV
ncbi:hypothetical protein FOZ62_000209, partial [Perkinsus olseni]